MSSTRRAGPATLNALEAARHICQEARVVLTSLRGGPPAVARGELAQDLMDLRIVVKEHLDKSSTSTSRAFQDNATTTDSETVRDQKDRPVATPPPPPPPTEDAARTPKAIVEDEDGAVFVQRADAQTNRHPTDSPLPQSRICNFSQPRQLRELGGQQESSRRSLSPEHVGMYARPFLAVVMDPRAAGPHTLVALRALFRLLERGSLLEPSSLKHGFHVALEPLMKGVLACKFEQTDAGADEAVEMAIADLLSLLVALDQTAFSPETLMDAFNTVFVTRNTFVHSPALCYHFEDVLSSMINSIFDNVTSPSSSAAGELPARLILEFLVNQLLHTPLAGGDTLDDAAREAQAAHDATRALCLHLTRCCLRTGWGHLGQDAIDEPTTPKLPSLTTTPSQDEGDAPSLWHHQEDRTLLQIIQDDLCLSLLMTGQAIWAYHDSTSNISPGFISLEVLSEICATLSTLWNTVSLRCHLVAQFEQIFTGFYQRALVLLRKRAHAEDPVSFNANLVFDAEVEIILESLVDLLCLHQPGVCSKSGSASALETLFANFDCSMSHADVASGLMLELCLCCGAVLDEDGNAVISPSPPKAPPAGTPRLDTFASQSSRVSQLSRSNSIPIDQLREVPAHLKELCAEALSGCLRCLFRDDHSIEKVSKSTKQGELSAVEGDAASESRSHRYIKSRKSLMRQAAKLFNQKSTKGIDFLVASGLAPDPVAPADVARFLRNGLIVGLDKAAVGSYLGEIGKAPSAGKSPPIWERDWFHKEVLDSYCSLFRFEGQSLLDGLRMFLAAFRLPGEGQQIDRIIQAFAESCGRKCDESARLKLFSDDPKRASDPAFLLAYSIIMLNTDLHNSNIREDRKMSLEAFIRNNTDYGRDITERGKELPREFLVGIYVSIRDEEIRTEGEGAEGHMTVERWKDVLRGSAGDDDSKSVLPAPDIADDDLREVVLESLWLPVLSAVSAFWGIIGKDEPGVDSVNPESSHNMMLGAQGARLGMDMALDLLSGVRNVGRKDVFQKVFTGVSMHTGLLGEYTLDAVDRTWNFVNCVEAQSAVVVAMRMARDAGDEIGVEGWKCVWSIIFELRDLKLLGGGTKNTRRGILCESDPDLLLPGARRDWNIWLVKGDIDNDDRVMGSQGKVVSSVFGAVGRALFGSSEPTTPHQGRRPVESVDQPQNDRSKRSIHGKEELVIWNELAPSDDEDESTQEDSGDDDLAQSVGEPFHRNVSAGTAFESQLIHEDMLLYQQADLAMPVTGLERVEDTRTFQISPRARVRKRLIRACDFSGLVSDSRFLDQEGFENLLTALLELVKLGVDASGVVPDESICASAEESIVPTQEEPNNESFDSGPVSVAARKIPLSPASEAFAEVLIAEIAIKNRDRLGAIWRTKLKEHYGRRLDSFSPPPSSNAEPSLQQRSCSALVSPGIEKCVTGLLRICSFAVQRDNLANEVIESLVLVYPSPKRQNAVVGDHLEKHLGEGLWRICRNVDGLRQLSGDGWEALLGLVEWCASVGDRAAPVIVDTTGRSAGLSEDNPALQAYRSLHLMLHAPELNSVVPFTVVTSIRALIAVGERAQFPKLSTAGLDLLNVLYLRLESVIERCEDTKVSAGDFWVDCWTPILEGMADAAKYSQYSVVRQHAISMLTDSFIDKHGRLIPAYHFCQVMPRVCIPLAGVRIAEMMRDDVNMVENVDEIMIEFELCISLLFKPLLHHLKNILSVETDFANVWSSLLKVMEELLGDGRDSNTKSSDFDEAQDKNMTPEKLRRTTKQLASEHLRNAVMVLIASGVLKGDPGSSEDISAVTWESIEKMEFCRDHVAEWKQSAM